MPFGMLSSNTATEYKEVRGLIRGLNLLRALNNLPSGGASTSVLARTCSIHRTTTKRILETLRAQGVVQLGSKEGFYMLSSNALELTSALHPVSWIHEVASSIMQDATDKLRWSCDIATFRNGQMIVRESTQRWNALHGHRALVGESVSAMNSALGQAYLSACDDVLRDKLIFEVAAREFKPEDQEKGIKKVHDAIQKTLLRGYAVKESENNGLPHLGAIGVAIMGQTRPIAAMNLVFENASVSQERLESYYLPELKKVASRIEVAYLEWRSRNEEEG